MALGPCSKNMQTYYQDGDGDGYGNPLIAPVQNCNPTPGWVSQLGDCDDSTTSIYPGVKRCFGDADYYTLQSCGNDGNWANTNCPNGCTHQQCKSFATVDIAGQVTCGAQQCSTSEGCSFLDYSINGPPAACGNPYSTQFSAMCDGPNDCPGQVCCWRHTGGGGDRLVCVPNDGSCPYSNPGGSGEVVCSPGQPACPGSMVCTRTDVSSLFAVWLCK
jgi:hypothetical protein